MMVQKITKVSNKTPRQVGSKNMRQLVGLENQMSVFFNALLNANVHPQLATSIIETAKGMATHEIKKYFQENPSLAFNPQELATLKIKEAKKQFTSCLQYACGESYTGFQLDPEKLNVIVIYGLYGCGKTTLCGKIIYQLSNSNIPLKYITSTSLDHQRIEGQNQLYNIVKTLGVSFVKLHKELTVKQAIQKAMRKAASANKKVLLIDTGGCVPLNTEFNAGELSEDESGLKNTIVKINQQICGSNINRLSLFVVDGFTGKRCATFVNEVNNAINIDGIVITKLNNQLPIAPFINSRMLCNKPIMFISTTNSIDGLEMFDVNKLVSQFMDSISAVEKSKMQLLKNLASKRETQKVAANTKNSKDARLKIAIAEEVAKKQLAIFSSMTAKERDNASIIDAQRAQRIAKGAGVTVKAVIMFIKNYTK